AETARRRPRSRRAEGWGGSRVAHAVGGCNIGNQGAGGAPRRYRFVTNPRRRDHQIVARLWHAPALFRASAPVTLTPAEDDRAAKGARRVALRNYRRSRF